MDFVQSLQPLVIMVIRQTDQSSAIERSGRRRFGAVETKDRFPRANSGEKGDERKFVMNCRPCIFGRFQSH